MKKQFEQTSYYIRRLNDFLKEQRQEIYRQISNEQIQNTGTLPLIDSLITITEELNTFLGDEQNNSLINMQTHLQSLTNQEIFEIQQLQGVTDNIKTLSALNASQLSPEEAFVKFSQIRDFLSDSAITLVQNQKVLNINYAQNESCFKSSQDILNYSLNKLSSFQSQNNGNTNLYNPTIEINNKIKNDSEQIISQTNTIMTPLFEDIEIQIKRLADCDFVDYEQLKIIGMSYIESISIMKTAYIDCENTTQNSIKEIFETTLKQKLDMIKEQIDISSKLSFSPEYNSKFEKANIDQLAISDTHMHEDVITTNPNYEFPIEIRNQINQIIEKQSQLSLRSSGDSRGM